MLSALSDAGVEYLVVGAWAMAAYGHVRSTGDIDIWVNPTRENAARVLQALRVFGAPLRGLTQDELTLPDTVFQIGVAPSRVDILTAIDGVDFAAAWENRISWDIAGISIPVLGREEFVINKRATHRPKDLADLDELGVFES